MSRPFSLALISLVALLGSERHFSSGQEPAKVGKADDPSEWWFSRDHLRAMKEPSLRKLAEKDRNVTAYRFLWLPSFDNPISVRFVKSDEGVALYAVRLDGKAGFERGHILVNRSANLSRAHWERIMGQLVKANFWTLPTSKRPPFGRERMDGDFLIVEGVSEGKYHVVMRQSPPGGDFVDLCRAMLFMSGIDVRKLWFEYRK